MSENNQEDKRHLCQISQLDKEKAVYQREMAKTINAAAQRSDLFMNELFVSVNSNVPEHRSFQAAIP